MIDIMALPYSQNDLKFAEIEDIQLQDITDYQVDFRKNGTTSKVLLPIAKASDRILHDYKTWYLRVLNSVYKEFYALPPIVGEKFICFPFVLGGVAKLEIPTNLGEIEGLLCELLNYRHSHQLWIRKILRVYDDNVVFIFKPNQIRYWTRSIAINDADATFADLVQQGF